MFALTLKSDADMLEIHIDPLGGIAGDMFVAALIDLRPDLEAGLHQTLASAPLLDNIICESIRHSDGVLNGRRFLVRRDAGAGEIAGKNAHPGHSHIHSADHAPHADIAWKQIHAALAQSALDEETRHHAIGIFTHLAEAEAHVHATSPETVHFHEVGAWDSIADIVSAAWLITQLKAARWSIGALPLGGGRISTAHGLLPVPAPATARLLEGFPMVNDGISGERVTPTGAAIVRYLCDPHETSRQLGRRLIGSAHGFGTRKLPGVSNCVRVLAFESESPAARHTDHIVVLECEIDDQTGEDLALASDRLRALEGVLDVIQSPVFGKKGRVMTHMRVLVATMAEDAVVAVMFDETTTLGLRRSLVERYILEREMTIVEDGDRAVRVKLAERPSGRTAKMEADDLADIAGARERNSLRRRSEAHFEDGEEN